MLYQQRVKTIDFALYFCHIFPSLRYLQVFLVSSQRVVQFGICLVWCLFFFLILKSLILTGVPKHEPPLQITYVVCNHLCA